MQLNDFVEGQSELAKRVNRIERWIEQFRNTNRKVKNLIAVDGDFSGNVTAVDLDLSGSLTGVDGEFSDTMRADAGYLVNSSTVGLGIQFHKGSNPASQSYDPGITVIDTFTPSDGYLSIIPLRWEMPPKIGNVETIVRFTFSDTSTTVRHNTDTGTLLLECRCDLYLIKDGLSVVQVEFGGDNVSGSPESQDLGPFTMEGVQV